MNNKNNVPFIAKALNFVGFAVIIIYFVYGIILSKENQLAQSISYCVRGIVDGFTFLGFAKIIELLSIIANNSINSQNTKTRHNSRNSNRTLRESRIYRSEEDANQHSTEYPYT